MTTYREDRYSYMLFIPKQFTMVAQQPSLKEEKGEGISHTPFLFRATTKSRSRMLVFQCLSAMGISLFMGISRYF